eukprot:SAG31_NODE_33421_length_344_cov_0.628571_1_plen_90_part_01
MQMPQQRLETVRILLIAAAQTQGMLNVSPIGRNCSQEERDAFEEYDKQTKVRATMIEVPRREIRDFNREKHGTDRESATVYRGLGSGCYF